MNDSRVPTPIEYEQSNQINAYLTDCFVAAERHAVGFPVVLGIWKRNGGAPLIQLWRNELPFSGIGSEMWERLTTGLPVEELP